MLCMEEDMKKVYIWTTIQAWSEFDMISNIMFQ